MNVAIGVLTLALCIIFIFGRYLIVKAKLDGKMMILMIERNRTVILRLGKVKENLVEIQTKQGKEIYHIDASKVISAEYPMTGLKVLRHRVPCLMYARDNPEPLDPMTVTILGKGITAKEMGSAMDEHIIDEIVRATEEERKTSIGSMVIPLATLAVIVVVLGLLWVTREQIILLVIQISELMALFRGEMVVPPSP